MISPPLAHHHKADTFVLSPSLLPPRLVVLQEQRQYCLPVSRDRIPRIFQLPRAGRESGRLMRTPVHTHVMVSAHPHLPDRLELVRLVDVRRK